MRLFRLFSIVFLSIFVVRLNAQSPEVAKQPRILILLDASASMVQPWANNEPRFRVAGEIVTALMDSIYHVNSQVEFALRVYGHQYSVPENNCFDTKREVMFSKNNITQMFLRINSLQPSGVSPIAYSLQQAAENDLIDEAHNAYSIVLITDGGESCNGNICDVVKRLLEKKIFFKPYVLGLVDIPSLKPQYDCLGSYLKVSEEKDVTPAIMTIVESYRRALLLPNIISKQMQIPTVITPRVLKLKAEIKKDTVVKTPEIKVVEIKPPPPIVKEDILSIRPYPTIRQLRILYVFVPSKKLPVTKFDLVKYRPEPESVAQVRSSSSYKLLPVFMITTTPRKLNIPHFTLKMYEPEAEPVTLVTTKPITKPNAEIIQPTKTITPPSKPMSAPPPPDAPKEATFTTKTETAKETSLQIYFTDGKGTFYKTTPQLKLTDHKTGKLVKQFYRMTDAAGEPDAELIPAGNYDIALVGKDKMIAKEIPVIDKQANKIIIKVPNGSLRFAYEGNPNRSVAEFNARVTRRFDNVGPTIEQLCTSELPYPPGNYYVEVNTLPITRFNVDLDFGSETEIRLHEPGFVQFINNNNVGKISLYYPLGDKYVRFFELNISSNSTIQKLQLQPMAYEVHYNKTPNVPYSQETVIKFLVTSNSITDVALP